MNTYRKKNYRNKRNYGGRPRRTVDNYHQPTPPDREMIPLSRHTLTKPDVEAVVESLLSGTLIQGRELDRFESLLAKLTHSDHAIALSTGTAALHAALACLKLEPEDEVIISTLNDCSSANMIRLVGAKPVLVDCNAETLTMDVDAAKEAVTENTKAILTNNFGGHPSDMALLREICVEHNLLLIEDASHGLGGKYRGHYVGNQADITCFSFLPSMAITTCEGGAVTTNNRTIGEWIRQFRNHGIAIESRKDKNAPPPPPKVQFAGMNYVLCDILAALGRSQLTRLDRHIGRRRSIAQVYQQKLNGTSNLSLPHVADWADHAYHLYPVQLSGDLAKHRDDLLRELRKQGVEASVHFVPIHQMPAYQDYNQPGKFPNAEAFYNSGLCLPLFPDLSYKDIERITDQLLRLFGKYDVNPEPPKEVEKQEQDETQKADQGAETAKKSQDEPVAADVPEDQTESPKSDTSREEPDAEPVAAKDANENKPEASAESEEKKPASKTGSRSRLRKVPKADEEEAEAPKAKATRTKRTTRTTRSRKPKSEAPPEGEEQPAKPKRRTTRRTTTKTTKSDKDEPKPKTRRPRTRKPKAEKPTETKKSKKDTSTEPTSSPKKAKAEVDSGES